MSFSLPVPTSAKDDWQLGKISRSEMGTWLGIERTGDNTYATLDGVPVKYMETGIITFCLIQFASNDIASIEEFDKQLMIPSRWRQRLFSSHGIIGRSYLESC